MSAPAVPGNTTDRIRRHLVGLKMPRALEALQMTLSRIEQGEGPARPATGAQRLVEPWMPGGDGRCEDLPRHRPDALAQPLCLERLEDVGEGAGGIGLHRSSI